MVRKRARIVTLLKLSPLYVVALVLLYILAFGEKEFDYLDAGRGQFVTGDYAKALDYLDAAIHKKRYRGQALLEALMLRARTLNIMKGYTRALADLDKITQLSPKSEEAAVARSMKGDIYITQKEYDKAIEVFEYLAAEAEDHDYEKAYEYQSKAAAAAYNYAILILDEVDRLLDRNLAEHDEELVLISRYVYDLHNDYELGDLERTLEEKLSQSAIKSTLDQAIEARQQYRYAHAILKEYPNKAFSNPVAAVFLVNIFYNSNRLFPAMLECSLALKGALPSVQRRELLQIMANIYDEIGAHKKAAEIYKALMKMDVSPRTLASLRRKLYMTYLEAEDYDKLIAEAGPSFQAGARDQLMMFGLGKAYQEKGMAQKAVPYLKGIVQALTNGTPLSYLDGTFIKEESFKRLHEAYLAMNDTRKALDVLHNAVRVFPENIEFRRLRAAFLDERMSSPKSAVPDYLYILENGPRDGEVFEDWYRAMDLNFQAFTGLTYKERAVQLVDKYDRKVQMTLADPRRYFELTEASTFPEAEADFTLRVAICRELLERGRRMQGKNLLRMIVRNNPKLIELVYRLAQLYCEENNPALAVKEFEKVRERDPTDIESIKRLLQGYRDLDDSAGQANLIRSVFERMDPHLTRWILARLSFEEGKLKDYLRMYHSLDAFPEPYQSDLERMAAHCHIAEENYDEAAKLLYPLMLTEPNHIENLTVWARWLVAYPDDAEALIRSLSEPSREEEDETDPGAEESPEEEADAKIEKMPARGGKAKAADRAEDVASEAEDSPEALDEESVDEAEVFPEHLLDVPSLLVSIRQRGTTLTKRDLEDLVPFFMELERPDLVLFVLNTDLAFELTPPIYRALARAHQTKGSYKDAAESLITYGTTAKDLRWAHGLALFTDELIPLCRRIQEKVESTRDAEPAEFFLRAAGGAALDSGVSEADRHLSQVNKYPGLGNFSSHEAEFIHYLTTMLKRCMTKGLDISLEEVPEPEETPEEETPSGAEESAAEDDQEQVLEEEEPPEDDQTAEAAVEGQEEVPVPVAEGEEEEPGEGEETSTESIEGDPGEAGEEVLSDDSDAPVEAVKDVSMGEEGTEPSTVRDTGRFQARKERRRGGPASRVEEDMPLDAAAAAPKSRRKARISIDRVPLNQLYKEIIPEAAFLEKSFSDLEPRHIVLARAMLKHLLLRGIPAMELDT
ncbi:MAG: tetratricopeptide repeat protein [Planctomycetota bacterium]|jgi:tetratricopeptide (TPR) repeat protein